MRYMLLAQMMLAQAHEQQNATMRQAVQSINLAARKENTSKAYDPKAREFFDFCNYLYGHEHESVRYTVDSTKLFQFLSYQAFRSRCKRGGLRKGVEQQHSAFNPQEYRQIKDSYQTAVKNHFEKGEEIPDPEDPLGFDQVNTYCSTVRNIWSAQVAHGCNTRAWDLVYDANCRELMDMVKKRRTRIKRKRYDEKLDGEFNPFTTLEQIKPIERWLWDHGKTLRCKCLMGLHSCFAFLECYGGVLRCESIFLGELSDMLLLDIQRKDDADRMEVMVMQIATGKTVSQGAGKHQYGRAMCHKDPAQCPVGSFGFYLMYRFHGSGEMDEEHRPDFRNNDDWFDIKILTDGSRASNSKEMGRRSYEDLLKKCFDSLLIFSSHYTHFGRVGAPPLMELEEVPQDYIRMIGK